MASDQQDSDDRLGVAAEMIPPHPLFKMFDGLPEGFGIRKISGGRVVLQDSTGKNIGQEYADLETLVRILPNTKEHKQWLRRAELEARRNRLERELMNVNSELENVLNVR